MKSRLIFCMIFAFLWAGAITARLWQLQVRDYESYRKRAERQQQSFVEVDPPRGTIYDSKGREMAVSVQVNSAFAVPREVVDKEATARQLGKVLRIDRQRIARSLESEREFVWIARKLDRPIAEKVRALDLPGIYFFRESKRYYPMGKLAASVLGYVGTDNYGLAGLEHVYDQVVAGRAERRVVLRDARRGSVLHPNLAFADAEPGEDLHLTIDASVQYIVETELAKTLETFRAKAGSVVILDPDTGAVLALASLPSFDPNDFASYPREYWNNRALTDAYEPGSTFKMITAAAALGTNVLDPSDVIDCEMGSIVLGKTRIRDHKPFGLLTFREVLAKSSNVGAIKAALLAGPVALHHQIDLFGFGRTTGIDLPGESAGIVHPLERWSGAAPAYFSFGQGISVTPLQLTSAFAAVANGGHLLKPYVVDAIGQGEDRRSLHPRPEVRETPITPETARALGRMLEGVVREGTGRRAAIEGYSVAGKTGTAQKAVPGRGYSATRFVASFVGYAPARNPKLVAIVAIDEPQTSIHGGSVAAPAFKNMVERILLYRGVLPEREPTVDIDGLELARHRPTDDEEGDVLAIDSEVTSGDEPSMKTVAGAA